MDFDVCIVGAGPAGLSAAIRFKQRCEEEGKDLSVCVVEKGAEVGAHILSGNVLETRALDELLPNWKEEGAPVTVEAKEDRFFMLTKKRAWRMPTPRQMHNKGNYVISLSQLTRWLGEKAEALGVEIYPGFAASEVLHSSRGEVTGIATNDFGRAKDGSRRDTFTHGIRLHAKATLFAEGCRGSLSEGLMKRFDLRKDADPQTYALGFKEVWEVSPEKHKPGRVWHTIGYPLDSSTYGGSFLYHMEDNKVALGFVVALDYRDPYLNPYQEFQRWKAHPKIAQLLEGGSVLQYGARTLNEGGLQSIPKLTFPGGALIGCSAGFLNVPKIKGTHTAMKSGMLAAEAAFTALSASAEASTSGSAAVNLDAYETALRDSWVWEELEREKNIRPGFKLGLWGGLANAALETYLLRGKAWSLHHRHPDHEALRPAAEFSPKEYPSPDGKVTFPLSLSLYRSGTNHDHNQPSHLKLRNPRIPAVVNLPIYAGPESRYCPAGVYEYVADENGRQQLQINAQNCLHCKACDIKDPTQNIQWTVPEGGGGPAYTVT
ncbi:hypothetical protein WJX72_010683 [[Myrmecia] bisecta]|uniref:Electron transfer flavoprotein-ubiquinone oxidoreductase n=1 Tax=[Myrmecia] bisecta TaxID=41462 RepID=A0AAW1R8Y8_9CHLO